MSRRSRIPAPFQRLLPSVIRGAGPRLVLTATACAALLLLGGGTYLIARLNTPAKTPAPQTTLDNPAQADAQVLGTATDQPDTGSTSSAGTATTPTPSPTHACTANCASNTTEPALPLGLPATVPVPSFDIVVNTAGIQHDLLGIVHVPFSIMRHNGLSTPIVPAAVSISSGGSLTNLVTVQAETMLDANNGVLLLAPVGLFPHSISVHFSAYSGSATASTDFTYRTGL